MDDADDVKFEKLNQIYKNAEKVFFHELDVQNLVKTTRFMKVFADSVLNRRQKILLRFQRSNLI